MGAAAAVALRGAVCAALLQVGTTRMQYLFKYSHIFFGILGTVLSPKKERASTEYRWFPKFRVVVFVIATEAPCGVRRSFGTLDGTVLVFFNKLQKQNVDLGRQIRHLP